MIGWQDCPLRRTADSTSWKYRDCKPSNQYTPLNFVVRDVEEVRAHLQEKGVDVSSLREGELKRFDVTDINGNRISVIEVK
jgi:hypothetical protein